MAVTLYLLISGDILYLGLGLVAAGVGVASWRRWLGGALAWSGLVFALASAVPIHPMGYALLVIAVAAWQLGPRLGMRVRRGTTIVLIVVVIGLLAAGVAGRVLSPLSLPRDRPVFVVGDSISAGLGTSREGTWPDVLSGMLGLEVTNLARAGAGLADGPSQPRAIPQGPATVLVELGGNDLLDGSSPARFAADLQSFSPPCPRETAASSCSSFPCSPSRTRSAGSSAQPARDMA